MLACCLCMTRFACARRMCKFAQAFSGLAICFVHRHMLMMPTCRHYASKIMSGIHRIRSRRFVDSSAKAFLFGGIQGPGKCRSTVHVAKIEGFRMGSVGWISCFEHVGISPALEGGLCFCCRWVYIVAVPSYSIANRTNFRCGASV